MLVQFGKKKDQHRLVGVSNAPIDDTARQGTHLIRESIYRVNSPW